MKSKVIDSAAIYSEPICDEATDPEELDREATGRKKIYCDRQ